MIRAARIRKLLILVVRDERGRARRSLARFRIARAEMPVAIRHDPRRVIWKIRGKPLRVRRAALYRKKSNRGGGG